MAPTESWPATTRAIVIRSKGVAAIDEAAPAPKLRDGYLRVRTTAVALNPTDWKHIDHMLGNPDGSRVGCDYAGVVVEVGNGVTQPFQPGDHIAGTAHGSNESQHEDGTFAEYIVVKAALAFKIPKNLSNVEASTLGLGAGTVGQGLYQALKLKLPTEPLTTPEPVLIYGGSTATGVLGIQFAKLSGYRVITAASPHNHEYLQSVGADAVFDYHDADAFVASVASTVKDWGFGGLRVAWDCVSSEQTARLCARALTAAAGSDSSSTKLLYRSLLPVPADVLTAVDARIDSGSTLFYTALGEPFSKGIAFPAVPEDFDFATRFIALTADLAASGKLKPIRPIVNRGGAGLEGVLVGLQELKADKVSGGKLVYTIGAQE